MKQIITIGREFGAGGGELGRRLARELGIAYYDRDIILRTAKVSAHLTPEQVRRWDERVPHEFGFTQSLFNFYERPLSEELWDAQVRAIREIADKESCVIVGRCANAILKERPCTFNVFIHAPLVPRIGRVMKRENIDHMEAAATIERIDAERAEHCKHFTDTIWGKADAYHLSLDSSFEPSEENATIIASLARAAFPEAPLSPCPEKPKGKS